MTKVAVIGAGGFGRECLDILEACNVNKPNSYEIVGVFDDGPSVTNIERLKRRGYVVRGSIASIAEQHPGVSVVVAIGSPPVRKAIVEACFENDLVPLTIIHPTSVIGSEVSIGIGTVVCANVVIATNVKLGRQTHLNANSTIGHDAILEDFVSVNPGAVISGEVTIGTQTLIGANATLLQGISTGKNVVVGASACVTRPVQDSITVKGVPAISV